MLCIVASGSVIHRCYYMCMPILPYAYYSMDDSCVISAQIVSQFRPHAIMTRRVQPEDVERSSLHHLLMDDLPEECILNLEQSAGQIFSVQWKSGAKPHQDLCAS